MNPESRAEFDPRYARIERRVQRVGWAVIALLLLLAVAGLFGGGLLSDTSSHALGEGYEVTLSYARFARAESNLEMVLEVTAPETDSSQLTATLSGNFLEKASISTIVPEPESQSLNGDALVLAWDVEDWSHPVAVHIEYEGRDWRFVKGRFDLGAGEQSLGHVSFKQFLFP